MSDEGRAVLDANRVLHIASGTDHATVCGAAWVAYDLHWDTTTRYHCLRCIKWADRAEAV